MSVNAQFDVIIIGGRYAGLSAAMALGRSLRKVLVIDSGLPCNRQTPHSHNLITHDGARPADITVKAKAQVLQYNTVEFVHARATTGQKTEQGFTIGTDTGEAFEGSKLIFATGITDVMPDIPGFAECWGTTVIHCPYCHGYEFRDRKTAIMASGEKGFHLASLVNNLTSDLTLFTSGNVNFDSEQIAKLNNHEIRIIETPVSAIIHENGHVRQIQFADGSTEDFDVSYAAVPFVQHSDIPATLGCELTDQGYIKVDQMQRTTIEGIYACGDNASMMRSVATAIYGGNFTGAVVNRILTEERF